MENSYDLSDSKNLQTNEPNNQVNLSKDNGQCLQIVCENSNKEQQRNNVSVKLLEKKLTKTCANQKHRSDCLKRYVYKKGPKYQPHFRHPKCAYILPVVHVCRRPDNPYGSYYVKSVVKSLKIDQPKRIYATKESFYTNSINYCSNLKGKFVRSKNWESIRYKNQLDFKERMKMEKETSLNNLFDKRKVVSTLTKPINYNIMPFYQSSLASMKRSPIEPGSIVKMSSNERLQRLSIKSNSLLYKNVLNGNKVANNEIDKSNLPTLSVQHLNQSIVTDKTNQPKVNEAIVNYYSTADDGADDEVQEIYKSNLPTISVQNLNRSIIPDKTNQAKVNEATVKYYSTGDDGADDEVQIIHHESKVVRPYQFHTADPMQKSQIQSGTYQVNDIPRRHQQDEIHRNKNLIEQLNNSQTGSAGVSQTMSETVISTQQKSYDFSIPFNESNIYIKVMSPDEKKQRNSAKRRSPAVLKNEMEKKQKLESLKKVRYNPESRTSKKYAVQPDSDENQWKWSEYIRNIVTKNHNPIPDDTNKEMYAPNSRTVHPSKTINPISMSNNFVNNQLYIDDNCITNEKRRPDITSMEAASITSPTTTNYYNSSLNEQITQSRLPINSTSTVPIVKPTVWHPSRYFRSDLLQHNLSYNADDTIGCSAPYSLIPQMSEGNGLSHQLDFHYNNHSGNYHPDYSMYSNRRIPPNNRFMRPPAISLNEQSYAQGFRRYRNDLERILHPSIDPYVRNDMHIPLNSNINYSQSRPTVDPRIYEYFGEPPMHPMWFYQHMSER